MRKRATIFTNQFIIYLITYSPFSLLLPFTVTFSKENQVRLFGISVRVETSAVIFPDISKCQGYENISYSLGYIMLFCVHKILEREILEFVIFVELAWNWGLSLEVSEGKRMT